MKKIEAIIKPLKLSNVKDSLHEIGLSGMTITDVKGFGRQRGSVGGLDNNQNYEDEFHAKIKIEISLILFHALVMKSAIRVPSASAYFRPIRVERLRPNY